MLNRHKAGGWRLLGMLLLMSGAWALAWAVFGRIEPTRESISQRIAARAISLPTTTPSSAIASVQQFAHIWNKDVRQSFDGTAPATVDAAVPTETVSSGLSLPMKLM